MKTEVTSAALVFLSALFAEPIISAVARAENLTLANPDFASGLAGWTQIGWGNDEPGMVYSTTAGAYLYQTVPSHALSADKPH